MALRNGDHGYGVVTKALHWVTFAAVTAQFVVGYNLDEPDVGDARDDRPDQQEDACEATEDSAAAEAEEERCEERLEQQENHADARADAAEDDYMGAAWSDVWSGDAFSGGLTLPELHVLLGLMIIGLGVLRVLWRLTTPLPPWADALSARERRLESVLEKALIALLFVVPGTGLLLVVGEDDWLAVHVAAHIAFFVTVGLHIGLVLKHTVIRRDRHLARML